MPPSNSLAIDLLTEPDFSSITVLENMGVMLDITVQQKEPWICRQQNWALITIPLISGVILGVSFNLSMP